MCFINCLQNNKTLFPIELLGQNIHSFKLVFLIDIIFIQQCKFLPEENIQ
jgi:hypothetical protein